MPCSSTGFRQSAGVQRRGCEERAGPQDGPDAEWLVHLLECGLLAGSFIPPAEISASPPQVKQHVSARLLT
jgi:hypothetical protein